MKHESRWARIRRQNEEARNREIEQLKLRLQNQMAEAGMYQNLCYDQRVILQEILAICAQEHFQYLEPEDRLERIRRYARRALASK